MSAAEEHPGEGWHRLWQEIGEGYLGGIQHALNNRVASLSAVAQMLGAGMEAAALVTTLADEVERLRETVGMISLLRRARSRAPEPVLLGEVVRALAPLLPHHQELRETRFSVEETPDLLPLWVEREQLTRVLLVLLAAAGMRGQQRGSDTVRVRLRGDQATVVARVEAEGAGVPGEQEAEALELDAVAVAARELGGEVELTPAGEAGVAFELRLPTLPEVRRRERAGGS